LERTVDGEKIGEALRDPHRVIEEFAAKVPEIATLPRDVLREVETEAKYAGFILRQRREADRLRRYSAKRIPPGLDLTRVRGLSTEARQKLARYGPATIGRALDAGISPSDALLLLAYLKEGR